MALRVVDGSGPQPPNEPPNDGGYGGDVLKEARDTVLAIMRGKGGRGSMMRLMAAKMVLAKDWLEHVSDADLLAEVRRRNAR